MSEEQIKQIKPKSKTALYVILGAIVALLLLGGYFLFSRRNRNQSTVSQQNTQTLSPSPQITPVTPVNADQTLNNSDATMQQAINQANSDLNSISNIDQSQDSTSGL